jgi:hypothetical protein
MHKNIEENLKEACDKNGLSAETFKAVKTILSKKINGMSVPAEAAADIARVFDLMKADRERNES